MRIDKEDFFLRDNVAYIKVPAFMRLLRDLFDWDGELIFEWLKRHFKIARMDRIAVRGPLDISGKPVRSLPKKMTVQGDFNMSNVMTMVTLPPELKVYGSFIANNSTLSDIPMDLRVKGDFWLKNCKKLKELPFDFKLEEGKNLILDGSAIKELPSNKENLKSGKRAYFEYFHVPGIISVRDTPISRNPELREKYQKFYRDKFVY